MTFQKGISGNPNGSKKMFNALTRAILHESREDLIHIYQRLTNCTELDLIMKLNTPDLPILERALVKAILSEFEVSSTATLEKLIERIHGKTIQPIVANIGVVSLEQLIAGSEKQKEIEVHESKEISQETISEETEAFLK